MSTPAGERGHPPGATLDASAWGGGRGQVWLLEDSPMEAAHAKRVLAHACDIRIFGDGESLLEAISRDASADLLILDWELPGLSGVEVCRFVRADRTAVELPIVIVTSHRENEDLVVALSSGANDYLTKPYDPAELFARVAAAMRTKRLFDRATRSNLALEEERRRVEESEARYRRLSDSGVIGIIETDLSGNVHHANDAFLALVGYSREELATGRMRSFELTAPQDRAADVRATTELLDRGVASAYEKMLVRKDGTYIAVSVASARLSPTSDRCVAYVLDVSARRDAEADRLRLFEAEREARREAEAASRMKDDFLATVSHELRTPLNAILGWTTLLRQSPGDAAALAKGLETVERNARAQAKLIEDILDVSRIIAGKVRLEVASIDVFAVVEHAVDTVRPTAVAKGVALELRPAEERPRFEGDGARIQQVVWNLLSNALKFTPTGGAVTVEMGIVGQQIEIRVADTGSGIPSDHIFSIFERFRQVDASTTRAQGGLGLGLAIVRHLVELHGGTVSAFSAGIGRGSTFTVRLPLRREIPQELERATGEDESARPPPAAPPPILTGRRVLVVDDEEDARTLVALVLRRAGAEVVAVESVEQALRFVLSFHPELILSDIAMPNEDGYALVKRIRALDDANEIPVVAITAYARAEDAERAKGAGFQRHMAKPVDANALVDLAAELLGVGVSDS